MTRLLLGLALGVLFGAAVVTAGLATGPTPVEPRPEGRSPPQSLKTTPVCAPGGNATDASAGPGVDPESEPGTGSGPRPESETGWIHVLPDGERAVLTVNATFAHGPDEHAVAWLYRAGPDRYVLAVWTENGSKRSWSCPAATRLTGTGAIPADFGTLAVVYEGRTVVTIERSAERYLWRLPSPVPANATAAS